MDEIQKPNNLIKILLHISSFQNDSCWKLCTLIWTSLVNSEVLLYSRPDAYTLLFFSQGAFSNCSTHDGRY
jgi:hypothetical protein